MGSTRVRLTDIAKELNISVASVSLVLSGKAKEGRISDTVAKNVINKATQMGYQANHIAQSLRTGRSNIIGLIVADITLPYFAQIIKIIEQEARKHGYQVMIANSDESVEKQDQLIEMFMSRQVDGVILAPTLGSEKSIEKFVKQGLDLVLIDRYFKDSTFDFVCSANFDGGYRLANILITNNRKKIAAITFENMDMSSFKDRLSGVSVACSENNDIFSKTFYIDNDNFNDSLKRALNRVIEDKYDGVFFINSALAIAGFKILQSLDITIGSDISIVAYDNPETYSIIQPAITCYEQPSKEMAYLAVDHLVKKIQNVEITSGIKLFVEGHLIIRNSH